MLRKSLLLGVGGSVAYCAVIAAIAAALHRTTLNAEMLGDPLALLALLPLIPGLLPGLLIAGALRFHNPEGLLAALLLSPFFNTMWVWFWLRRRARQQSDCCS